MTGSLDVKIDRPLPLQDLLSLAGARLKQMLGSVQELKILAQAPPAAYSPEIRDAVPSRPEWGMYFSLEGVNESLVDAHLSTLSLDRDKEPVVIHFEERRTPASKVLAAGLAIAAAELLGKKVFDYEHVWAGSDEVSPSDLQQQLTIDGEQLTLESALTEFSRKMNRPE